MRKERRGKGSIPSSGSSAEEDVGDTSPAIGEASTAMERRRKWGCFGGKRRDGGKNETKSPGSGELGIWDGLQ